MARDFYINGESMVTVKGRSDSAIGSLSQLGLSADPIVVTCNFQHQDINVDAWGKAPADVQWMLADAMISMTLVHFDMTVLRTCVLLSMGGASNEGQVGRAGTRMGGNYARFAAGNNYIGLNIASPVVALPWRFYFAYLANNPITFPLGTERSLVRLTWRAVPYVTDPWNGGLGATNAYIWDRTADS